MKSNSTWIVGASGLIKACGISQLDLSQEVLEMWKRAYETGLRGSCTIKAMKQKPYLPIIEFKETMPILTMKELQDEVRDLREEVNKLKRK